MNTPHQGKMLAHIEGCKDSGINLRAYCSLHKFIFSKTKAYLFSLQYGTGRVLKGQMI